MNGKFINRVFDIAEDMLFPWDACCVSCRRERLYKYGFCRDCFTEFRPFEGERCEICRDKIETAGLCKNCFEERPDYERLFVPFVFCGSLRKMLHDFKFKNLRYLRHPLGRIALSALPESVKNSVDVIVPVPISPLRLKERKYNQAAELAREVSALTGLPVCENALKKREGQMQMALLSKDERRKNTAHIYYSAEAMQGRRVLLVDDICTTGETLRACARELKNAGAGNIYCLCVARTDKDYE